MHIPPHHSPHTPDTNAWQHHDTTIAHTKRPRSILESAKDIDTDKSFYHPGFPPRTSPSLSFYEPPLSAMSNIMMDRNRSSRIFSPIESEAASSAHTLSSSQSSTKSLLHLVHIPVSASPLTEPLVDVPISPMPSTIRNLALDHPRLQHRKWQRTMQTILALTSVGCFITPFLPTFLEQTHQSFVHTIWNYQALAEDTSLVLCPTFAAIAMQILTGSLLIWAIFLLLNNRSWRPAKTVTSVAMLLQILSIWFGGIALWILNDMSMGLGVIAPLCILFINLCIVLYLRRAVKEDIDEKPDYYDECII